jgi:hypothetical protein
MEKSDKDRKLVVRYIVLQMYELKVGGNAVERAARIDDKIIFSRLGTRVISVSDRRSVRITGGGG